MKWGNANVVILQVFDKGGKEIELECFTTTQSLREYLSTRYSVKLQKQTIHRGIRKKGVYKPKNKYYDIEIRKRKVNRTIK